MITKINEFYKLILNEHVVNNVVTNVNIKILATFSFANHLMEAINFYETTLQRKITNKFVNIQDLNISKNSKNVIKSHLLSINKIVKRDNLNKYGLLFII
jgi:hypothetical protein